MSITLKNAALAGVEYSLQRTAGDRAFYLGPNHTDKVTDEITITSTAPRRTSSSFGNRRSSINLLGGTVIATPTSTEETKTMKMEIVSSVPVGITDAEVDELHARLVSFAEQKTLFKQILLSGKIQF